MAMVGKAIVFLFLFQEAGTKCSASLVYVVIITGRSGLEKLY
ncbi:hypothetical protein SanJ4211_1470 [Streptococcus anginosus]|nr:hypothetical protein SanJ4211_1470 [Streptococcus anginosus]